MAAPNQYPPEKSSGQYPPPPPADAQHHYPQPPPESAYGQQAPPQQYSSYQTGEPQYQYPPPPPVGPRPTQEQYQVAAWIPPQNQNYQYDAPPSTATAPHKTGFGSKLLSGFEKLGAPINKFSNKIGSEAFWPQSLDGECNKCARILKSFCKDGFYSERPHDQSQPIDGPKGKPTVLVKIPQKVIKNAVGLAIFTTMRTGMWVSGAGGSGVLIARLPDGSWSPPSGLLIHTAGLGFMVGIDIYDCVLVINTLEALAAFKRVRLSLGGEISVAAGPVGIGGVGEIGFGDSKPKPIWTYMKSRGLYAGVQVDGSIVVERKDENARYYGERIPAADILAGKVRNIPQSTRMLMEVLKEAEGRQDVNHQVLREVDELPPPSDIPIERGTEPTKEQKEQYAHEGRHD